jgi:hypothetical protein
VRRAAATAERSSSEESVRVTTAPGSTTAGIVATGRRTALGLEIVEVAESLMRRGYRLAVQKLNRDDS